jgi:hypothetical protein
MRPPSGVNAPARPVDRRRQTETGARPGDDAMKQATIEIDDELEEALAAYGRARGLGDDLSRAAAAALSDHLVGGGYLISTRNGRPARPITPLHRETGPTAVGINHDQDPAEGASETLRGAPLSGKQGQANPGEGTGRDNEQDWAPTASDHAAGEDADAPAAFADLRDHLLKHGYTVANTAPPRPFRVTPLHRDDGPTDVSINHDRYLAEPDQEGDPR